jgi:hypothetical protein
LDVGAEMRVSAAFGEIVEDGADGRVGCASWLTERHGDVESMDHDVVECAVVPTARWRPAVQRLLAQVPDERGGRQLWRRGSRCGSEAG